MKLKDNYDEQMKRLRVMCEEEGLADKEVTLSLSFAHQGDGLINWAQTLTMKNRIEAALEKFGLTYTMLQDPESPELNPVFVVFLVGPTRKILDFYEAIGDR